MRMEELYDNRYIKNPDSVEKYLLNLVQEYFASSGVASSTSREHIINKAVERMKEEISFDNIGVLSIIMPDGEIRTGAVEITLQDLNGEPLIPEKMSAFNVPFGTEQNTACEGNDPRLSDARNPLPHDHEISEIIGLEGILSSIQGRLDRADTFLHRHTNKNVLDMLVYTGSNASIDLTVLDTLENKIISIVDTIKDEVVDFRTEIDNKITEVKTRHDELEAEVLNLNRQVVDENAIQYQNAKDYADQVIEEARLKLEDEIRNLITRDVLTDMIDIVNNSYMLVGTMIIPVASILDINAIATSQTATVSIDAAILTELTNRAQGLADCQIEMQLEYKEPATGATVYGHIPHIMFENNTVTGSLQVETDYTSNTIVAVLGTQDDVAEEVKEAKIIYTVYSKRSFVL